ncbi:MAG TPA: hypothetical protein ENN39_06995 [Desulfonatronum sp.]|mgnify:CR=1 FL=1|nr:hypothetical protein [Desulfonatronum sp.]
MTRLPLILLSLALYAAGTWIARNSCRRLTCLCFSLCGFSLIFISGFFLISDAFTTSGIDESIAYHLKYGLAGAGMKEYRGSLIATAATVFLALATFFFSLRILALHQEKQAQTRAWAARLMLGASLLVHPGVQDVYSLNAASFVQPNVSARFANLYMMPTDIHDAPTQPKNLVYIYAESLERTYFDERLFPDLIVKLKELEQGARSFTGVEQVSGTHWTIAGMVASQCGIPLVTASGGNSMSGIDHFLPGATCLGDVLRSRGYALTFMGGADLDFAGKGTFLASHGFAEILGKNELQGFLSEPDYVNAWGLYDDFLLDHVYQRFEILARDDAPFALFTLTLDTHHPKGHLSRRCRDMPYRDGSNDILNAVHCSDFLIAEFVHKVLQSPHARNTLIIIASDHLAMGNTATSLLAQGDRKNLFMVIDPSGEETGFVAKKGSTLDIAATVLNILGHESSAFGLGRSLLSDEPALVAQENNISRTLSALSREISNFWEYPTIQTGVLIDARKRQLHIGERTLGLPTLLHFGHGGKIKNVFFGYQLFDYSEKLATYVEKMHYDDAIAWIDSCRDLQYPEIASEEGQFCVFLGKIGDENPFISTINDELFIPMDQFTKALARVATPMVKGKRRNNLDSLLLAQLLHLPAN